MQDLHLHSYQGQAWSMAKFLRRSGPLSTRSLIALVACQPLTAVKHLTIIWTILIGRSLLLLVSWTMPSMRNIFWQPSVDRLCEKFPKAGKSVTHSERSFDALNRSADQTLVKIWEEQEAAALKGRNGRPESMDIYDIKIQKGSEQPECSCLAN